MSEMWEWMKNLSCEDKNYSDRMLCNFSFCGSSGWRLSFLLTWLGRGRSSQKVSNVGLHLPADSQSLWAVSLASRTVPQKMLCSLLWLLDHIALTKTVLFTALSPFNILPFGLEDRLRNGAHNVSMDTSWDFYSGDPHFRLPGCSLGLYSVIYFNNTF